MPMETMPRVVLSGSPKFIIQVDIPLTEKLADQINAAWAYAIETGKPIVLDTHAKIFMLNTEGEWTLLDSSQVIP